MACACKVNQDLAYLQKKYGVGGQRQKETHIRKNASIFLKELLIWSVLLPFLPIAFIIIIMKHINHNGKPIKITELIGFKKLNH